MEDERDESIRLNDPVLRMRQPSSDTSGCPGAGASRGIDSLTTTASSLYSSKSCISPCSSGRNRNATYNHPHSQQRLFDTRPKKEPNLNTGCAVSCGDSGQAAFAG